jgi:hypothetical protein
MVIIFVIKVIEDLELVSSDYFVLFRLDLVADANLNIIVEVWIV